MGLLMQNTILKQAEAKIESQMRPDVRDNYMRIVVAGMKLALDKGPQGIMAGIKTSQNPLADIVKGAIGIVGTLRHAAKGTMPVTAMVPAGFTLMLHGLDFAEKVGVLQVTNAVLDQATQAYAEAVLAAMKISPAMVQSLTQKVHGVMQDPAKMAHLKTLSMHGAQPGGSNGAA